MPVFTAVERETAGHHAVEKSSIVVPNAVEKGVQGVKQEQEDKGPRKGESGRALGQKLS